MNNTVYRSESVSPSISPLEIKNPNSPRPFQLTIVLSFKDLLKKTETKLGVS